MHLRHLHLRNPIPYATSLSLQEAVLEKHFAYKSLLRKDTSLIQQVPQEPQPTLLTFQTHPTYTVGRRHLTANPLSPEQISFLTGGSASSVHLGAEDHEQQEGEYESLATFFPSPRGGLLTYHAPGQLTAYLILNLRTHNLTPRCYIRLLENTIIRTCARHGVPNVMTTEDPGVWIAERSAQTPPPQQLNDASVGSCDLGGSQPPLPSGMTPTDRKICAIGVHVSRGITSHGVGLNVFDSPIAPASTLRNRYTIPKPSSFTSNRRGPAALDSDMASAPGYLSWGFGRIVACGLEGKSVTWLSREQELNRATKTGYAVRDKRLHEESAMHMPPSIEAVAQSLALEVKESLKIDAPVESIEETDIFSV